MAYRYFYLYKPYGVLCQFSAAPGKLTLRDVFENAPRDVYPVGRLDYDSEGLLVLSNDPALNSAVLLPKFAHEREYWVQVEGAITREALQKLSQGLWIRIGGKPYRTKPSLARMLQQAPHLPARSKPVRVRPSIPDSWISLVLEEGKNRQVRRMTAAVGFPTLRLVRFRMEGLNLDGLAPGEVRELDKNYLFRLLRLL